MEADFASAVPGVRLAPYTPDSATLPQVWPYTVGLFHQLAQLASEHHARAVVLLSAGAEPLDWQTAQVLAAPVLDHACALAVADYSMGRYEGLFNTAILRPLACTLFSLDLHYPLAPDMAMSCSLLESLATMPVNAPIDESIAWPSLAAVLSGAAIAQVPLGHREFPQPAGTDVSAILTQLLNSLFDEIERSAGYWQRNHPAYPVREGTANFPHPELATEDPVILDVSHMLESFHLGIQNLQQDVWAHILSPATLLGVKRAAAGQASALSFNDKLWVRVVFDFLAAYRSRSVNRTHIFGAFLPLYMGWAASHLLRVESLNDAQAAELNTALAQAFNEDKPYLMARWRWPDRFTP